MKTKMIYLSCIAAALAVFFNADTKGIKITDKKGNEGYRWAICIGINDYWDDRIADLKKARNDAKIIGSLLEKQGQFDKVFIMDDELGLKDKNYPTKFNIEANINYVTDMAGPNDLVLFHFSGHGIADANGESYLITSDTRLDNLFPSSVKLDYVVNRFKSKGIKKLLLLVDACREEISQSKGISNNNFNAGIYKETDLAAAFFSTKQGWFSYEDPKSDYGIFSRFVAEALAGKGDADSDGVVTFSELEKYVTKEIFSYSVDLGYKQMPYTKIYGEKFGDLALTATGSDKNIQINTVIEKNNSSGAPEGFVNVKGGYFRNNRSNYYGRNVGLSSFMMGKYEVTLGEFKQFINETGYKTTAELNGGGIVEDGKNSKYRGDANWKNPYFYQDDKSPVVMVSWYDCIEYCNWKSKKEGLNAYYTIDKTVKDSGNTGTEDKLKWKVTANINSNGYRLPTEAEWEYAAGGGENSANFNFAGSDNFNDTSWCSETIRDEGTRAVGVKKPNELGIYDMSGNAWEWCWDWYGGLIYNVNDPSGAASGDGRVLRGGGWSYKSNNGRIYERGKNGIYPDAANNSIGFRIVRSIL